MEINSNRPMDSVARAASQPVRARTADQTDESQSAVFEGADALDAKLKNEPEIRPDVVSRARELVTSADYPPPETIRKIATLLAAEMQDVRNF